MRKILLLVGLVSLVFMGCPEPKTLETISVKINKQKYTVGESVGASDIEVTASYSDGTKETVSGYTVNPSRFNEVDPTAQVTITYAHEGIEKSATYKVTVEYGVPVATEIHGTDFVRISAGRMPLRADGSYIVTLTRDYEICKHEVTQKEYATIMGTNPSGFKDNPASGEDQEQRPVENISWFDAVLYCNKRTEAENITINGTTKIDYVYFSDINYASPYQSGDSDVFMKIGATGYRLPTDAEWEIAARGGLTGDVYAGTSDDSNVGIYSWFKGNSGIKTHQVMKKEPNGYGLYDMSGNVWEWCWDCYDSSSHSEAVDPLGGKGDTRVIRGGGIYEDQSMLIRHKVTYYTHDAPGQKNKDSGFRVVRTCR